MPLTAQFTSVPPTSRKSEAMVDTDLSMPERTTLLALFTVGGEISNKDLRERYGFALDGKDRTHLEACGYVSSRRGAELPGRPFVHELTDLGWRRARQELASTPAARTPRAYRILYGFANVVDRYMTRSNITLADILAVEVDVAQQIRTAYADLAEKPGAQVGLRALREHLAGVPASEFDAALLRLAGERGVILEPEPKLRSLTPADRKAAVRVGGQDKHLLSIEQS